MSENITARKFTGWHMTAILVVFFGIIMAVNFNMARLAIGTFGGTVVDNSYVASQNYNRWLADAREQEALGWKTRVSLTQDRFVQIAASKDDAPLTGVMATGTAEHPLGQAPSIDLDFIVTGDGKLQSKAKLPAGRWNAIISLRSGPDIYKLLEPVQ